jgi:protein-disulfide isomerase
MPSHEEGPTLTPPVSVKRDHLREPDDAPVTLVEYGDYQCPFCGQAHGVLQELLKQVRDQVRLAFRNFPLTEIHAHAQRAAQAAESAAAQGRFWEMHDMLYDHQEALEDEDLLSYAAALGLDQQRFEDDLARSAYSERIREDFMSGVRSGVNGTPTFFVNGRRHDGPADLRSLLAAVSAAATGHAKSPRHAGGRTKS